LGGKYDGPINFKVGQRLEALDRQHGSNIYVAHVAEINEKKQLKIQLDGYQSQYWCYPDSNEVHFVFFFFGFIYLFFIISVNF